MYLFRKEVAGNYYYWNDKKKSWQGVIDNATRFTEFQIDLLFKLFEDQAGNYSRFYVTQ